MGIKIQKMGTRMQKNKQLNQIRKPQETNYRIKIVQNIK
jgi:hypothetical protein